jgi:hypothetical protein
VNTSLISVGVARVSNTSKQAQDVIEHDGVHLDGHAGLDSR